MLTHYDYPGDSTPDSGSANGQGAFQFTAPHSLIAYTDPSTPASAGLSADMAAKYNVTPGQNFQVTGSNGITYNLIYMDTGADWETGRVDIYDPNNVLGGSNDFGAPITSFTAGTMATLPATASNTGGNPGLFNSLLHPIQTAQIAGLGLFTLVLSYVAAFVQWLVAVAAVDLALFRDRTGTNICWFFDGQRLRGNCEDIYSELRRDLHVAAGVFGRRLDNSNAFGFGCQYRQRPRRWVLMVYLRFALGDFWFIRWAVVDLEIVRARRKRRC